MSAAPLKLYSYSRCSTCRKALQWLAQQGFSVENGRIHLVDITTTPPSVEELTQALATVGRQRLFNTSGQSYRALGRAAVAALDDDQAVAALATDGRLIKRPLLLSPDGPVLVGFRPEEWSAALQP